MRIKTYIFLAFGTIYLGLECTHNASLSHTITNKSLQSHVEYLSSDALEGRLTGTNGEQLATQYAANILQHLGLEPAGDNGTFFQEFGFTAGVSFGNNNSCSIINQNGVTKKLLLDQAWRPLSFSDNKLFAGSELVFAGYGITAPALGNLPVYDSYHGLNVKNKWVIVFRYMPENISDEQHHQLQQYSSPRYKAFTAKENGAKGIIFVSGPNSKVKNELIPLSFDTSLSSSGIVAISVEDTVVNELLTNNAQRRLLNNAHQFNSLQKLQDKLDSGQLVAGPVLTGIKLACLVDIQQIKKHGRNVLARLMVGGTTAPMIIVGAHIDHLGRGELSGSRSREDELHLIHYGADDNASGVASVLEVAMTLRDLQTQGMLYGSKNILFALWSGEELGLLGSAHFIKNFMEKTKTRSLRPAIDVNINLDMVGRLRKNLILQGVSSSSHWLTLIEHVAKRDAIPLITQNDPYLPTDSTSFYLHGVPALNFFTGSHDEYHTPRDKPETLNYQGMKHISNLLVDLILALEIEPNLLDYQQVPKTGHYSERGFRVYLGTIPDYTSSDRLGVKLSGVTKDSPAELAGLRKDDIIVELAGKKIHDIYDYTFVLNSLRIGHPVALVVLRGQAKVNLTIVAQSRE